MTEGPKIFIELSKLLTGFDDLPEATAKVYYDIFSTNSDFRDLMVELVQGNISDLVDIKIKKKEMLPLFSSIIKLWYLGRMDKESMQKYNIKELSKDGVYFHYESLIWRALHAHPTALAGGYFGHWAYKPEN